MSAPLTPLERVLSAVILGIVILLFGAGLARLFAEFGLSP